MLLILANCFGYISARRYHVIRREEFRVQSVFKNLSERDPLTGCHNRRYLQQELLNMELSRARRFRLSLAVIACDIDYFKSVNDTYGHAAGDRVLVAFTTLLRGMIRENVDSLIRFGGEEFLLVLPETDLAGAMHLAERMRLAVAAAATNIAPGKSVSVTASFGVTSVNFANVVARFPQESVIELADQLLYAAKHDGRNTVKALEFYGRPGLHVAARAVG
nr:GGDEF domain-containing protein [Pseudoduganella dura]